MENEILRILLADDDESDRYIFNEALLEIETNCSIHNVKNGIELLEYLQNDAVILPDILFLDLNMPRKNGLECLKEIRSNEKFKKISIAIYSTSVAEKDVNETFINGANIYIKKPNNFASLKQLLCKAIKTYYLYKDESFERTIFLLCV